MATEYVVWISGREDTKTNVVCEENVCPAAKMLMENHPGLKDGMGFLMCYSACDKQEEVKNVWCQVSPDMILTSAAGEQHFAFWKDVLATIANYVEQTKEAP